MCSCAVAAALGIAAAPLLIKKGTYERWPPPCRIPSPMCSAWWCCDGAELACALHVFFGVGSVARAGVFDLALSNVENCCN